MKTIVAHACADAVADHTLQNNHGWRAWALEFVFSSPEDSQAYKAAYEQAYAFCVQYGGGVDWSTLTTVEKEAPDAGYWVGVVFESGDDALLGPYLTPQDAWEQLDTVTFGWPGRQKHHSAILWNWEEPDIEDWHDRQMSVIGKGERAADHRPEWLSPDVVGGVPHPRARDCKRYR